ncbi:hypothetical protein C241_16198 [Bradyrhizobium lupini HPC(L)]|uniref:Uncharacterized protein n=1 Tax=Bradyrhizobium lupini HPC(L) TaxID=1229491 RepID=A0ABN0HJL3_RHILU|nr:hypothetical protein C241_16198 [Bradyrhizobium lupini HPC(L)]
MSVFDRCTLADVARRKCPEGRAVAPCYAMAGDRHGKRIARASACDCLASLPAPDPSGELFVAHRLARRNFAQCQPHSSLKGGASQVERKTDANLRRLYHPNDPSDDFLILGDVPYQNGV